MDKKIHNMLQPAFGLYFTVILIFTCMSFAFSVELGIIELVVSVILFVFYFRDNNKRKRDIMKCVERMSSQVNVATKASMTNCPIPMVVCTAATSQIIWCNDRFLNIIGKNSQLFQWEINDVIPGFNIHWFMEGNTTYKSDVCIDGRFYTICASLSKSSDDSYLNVLVTMYFVDCTDRIEASELYSNTRPTVAIICLDSYDELLKNVTDSEKSSLLAAIDKKVNEWTQSTSGILRKFDRDKFIYMCEQQDLNRLVDDKFSVLDEVRTIVSPEGINATLSVGIGKDGDTLSEKYSFAGLALDMALSRGGDQAVIKNKYTFEFFGGRSKEIEKRTKVKARVMANALNRLIKDSSKVFVMGHRASDIDSLGASVGMLCAARANGKQAKIVIDRNKTLAQGMIKKLEAEEEYKNILITPEDAMLQADANTLLIVVDTNRPDYVESESLLQSINRIAVIDHHRRAAEYIENCAVNVHEPYASSASELVTELLQYMIDNKKLMRVEAECLLAGIYLDTRGFTVKAGVRTFEAAAYLKRAGADMVEVKKLFQNSFDSYMEKQRIIACAKSSHGDIVIAIADFEARREIAGKAADDMLEVSDVKAAFVVFLDGDDVVISARSLGDINVQVIIEKLGGGGNLASAGAQISNADIFIVENRLRFAINQYFEEENNKKS